MNKKILVLHATEPECKTCLVGTWYDSVLETDSAIKREEEYIHTSIMYAKCFSIYELMTAGYSVYLLDIGGCMYKLSLA